MSRARATSAARACLAALSTALLLGCAGDGRRPGAGSAVVPVDRLPDAQRAVLEAYREGGATWDRERERVRGDPELLQFAVDNLAIELVRAHDALVTADADRARRAYDRAQAELARLAPESVPALVELFAVGDDVVARQMGEVLALVDGPGSGAPERVARLLEGDAVASRRRAARLLGELPPAGAAERDVQQALAERLRRDADWSVRAEAARSLGRRAGRGRETGAARVLLEGALADADAAVARCAAEGLGAIQDPLSVPALTDALERAVLAGDLRLLGAAQGALVRVTGERFERDVAGWRGWWRDHGGAIRARAAQPAR